MLTLRLPFDDRVDDDNHDAGLAEMPAAFQPCAEGESIQRLIPDDGETAAVSFGPDQDVMGRQLEIACRHGAIVERLAARHAVLPSVIAGLCSRRSGWGLGLSPVGADGTRDFTPRAAITAERHSPLPPDGLGFKRGLAGLDYDRDDLARDGCWWDPEVNLEAAFTSIADHRSILRRRTTLQGAGLLRGSLTAFECGLQSVLHAVRRGLDVDSPSFASASGGQGCGRDVLARAGFFRAHGWD